MAKITVPIGPQHPALKEPEHFAITLNGETIISMDMRLGYNHRGIEKGCEERNYVRALYLIERVCGICSHAHSTCFIQAVEEIAGLTIPPRAVYIRTIIGELERMHSHLLWLGVAAHEIGFDTLLMYSWRDREVVMETLAAISGNRVHYGINTLGGVRRDLSKQQLDDLLKAMDILEERTKYYIEVASEETTILKRLAGVGSLSHEDAMAYGTIGPTGRASGVPSDVRRDDPYLAYPELDFKVITDNNNDVFGRVIVRLGELMESYKMVRQLVAKIPDGPVAVKAPRKIPAGEALSRYEAPRGEDVHYVKGNGTEKLERVKVRAPTLANLHSVAKMMENNRLADAPLIVAAIDPCFSCTDRMVRLQDGSGEAKTMSWLELRRQSIAWYSRNGVDFTELNRKLLNKPIGVAL